MSIARRMMLCARSCDCFVAVARSLGQSRPPSIKPHAGWRTNLSPAVTPSTHPARARSWRRRRASEPNKHRTALRTHPLATDAVVLPVARILNAIWEHHLATPLHLAMHEAAFVPFSTDKFGGAQPMEQANLVLRPLISGNRDLHCILRGKPGVSGLPSKAGESTMQVSTQLPTPSNQGSPGFPHSRSSHSAQSDPAALSLPRSRGAPSEQLHMRNLQRSTTIIIESIYHLQGSLSAVTLWCSESWCH